MRVRSVSERQDVSNTTRDEIVLDHLPLVKAIAIRVHESLPVHVDLDDLIHAGILGLFDAAEKYDSAKQVEFHAYAKHRIKGAILDSLRQLDWASRDLRRRQKQVDTLTRELTARFGRTPTEEEIAESLGLSVEHWRQGALQVKSVGSFASSGNGPEQETTHAAEFPAKPDSQPDHICARTQLRRTLSSAMKTLPERYQKVVLLYYTSEMTMKEIGSLLGVNESRVSQIHKTALEKMANALHSAGIHSSCAF